MLVIKPEEEKESRATEGARRATGVGRDSADGNGAGPDPEVADKATRRRFSAEYKLEDIADRNGVIELYRNSVSRLQGLLNKHTTRSSIGFTTTIDGSRKTLCANVDETPSLTLISEQGGKEDNLCW